MDEEYKNYRTYTDKEWKELKGISDSVGNYYENSMANYESLTEKERKEISKSIIESDSDLHSQKKIVEKN